MTDDPRSQPETPAREPVFNAPFLTLLLPAALIGLYALQASLGPYMQDQVIESFGLSPVLLRQGHYDLLVTHLFLHGSWMHLGVNAVWLMAFGTPVARRFGTMRFLAFYAVTAVAGAGMHLLTNAGSVAPMIGASASISGAMAASMRFAFQRGGPLGGMWRTNDEDAYRVPALSLIGVLSDARVLLFVGVWFGVNILFGMWSKPVFGGEDQAVAWQAHIGGFLAGLLLFSWFDPVRSDLNPREDIALH